MPLVWAHSEFIKLCYSHTLGYPVDRPAATWNRYQGKPLEITHHLWGPRYRPRRLKRGNRFTIALRRPALVHWGVNGWNDARDSETDDTGLGVWAIEIPVTGLSVGDTLQFTFYWRDDATWEGSDYEVVICE